MAELKPFYISLVRGLLGYYVKVLATNSELVREYAFNYMGKMWCSVYDQAQIDEDKQKDRFEINIINEEKPVILNDSSGYD